MIYCATSYQDARQFDIALLLAENNLLDVGLHRGKRWEVHEGSVSSEVTTYFNNDAHPYWESLVEFVQDAVEELRRDLSQQIYFDLRAEYEYLMSEESIIETFEANEYMFTADGEID